MRRRGGRPRRLALGRCRVGDFPCSCRRLRSGGVRRDGRELASLQLRVRHSRGRTLAGHVERYKRIVRPTPLARARGPRGAGTRRPLPKRRWRRKPRHAAQRPCLDLLTPTDETVE
jgi:hypothetical protein